MMPIRLPRFANHRTKYLYGAAIVAFTYLGYSITNHLSLFPSRSLPLTSFEEALPLLPWTIWPYLTSFPVMVLIFFDVRSLDNLHRLTYAFLALQLICNLVFIFFPVAMPRELFPLPDGMGPVMRGMFEYTRTVDTARNCVPSLHVANSCLISLVYLKENRRKLLLAGSWVALVAFSTLGTKQHYLWDVVSGLGIAVALYLLAFNRKVLEVPAPR
jgi:membrane-associated phospholipid phosphatase